MSQPAFWDVSFFSRSTLDPKGPYHKKCKRIAQCYGNNVLENLDSKLSKQAENIQMGKLSIRYTTV